MGLSEGLTVGMMPLQNTVFSTDHRDVCALVQKANLVAVVSIVDTQEDTIQKSRTGEKVGHRNVIRVWQPIRVQEVLGPNTPSTFQNITLQTYALDPQPPAPDPLNARYPGAYAEGMYVMFLRGVNATVYETVEGWKGVYPLRDGRLSVLEGYGLPSLTGMNKDTLKQMVQRCK